MANSDENISPEVNPYAEGIFPLSGYNKTVEVPSHSSRELAGDNVAENTAGRALSHSATLQRAHSDDPIQADITRFIEISQNLERELQNIVIGQERIIRELL